jgi:acid phosphatase (class B)
MKRISRGCFIFVLLVLFLSVAYAQQEPQATIPHGQGAANGQKIGFDLDDTLLFSTPAFNKGFRSVHKPFSKRFWALVNKSDKGNSIVKERVRKILDEHKNNGDEIFIITARFPYKTKPLTDFLVETFQIEKENIYFEPRGKAERIKSLKLDIFYGDSDSDISAAIESGAKGMRILRSPSSWYKKKYNPGKYHEHIIENSEE